MANLGNLSALLKRLETSVGKLEDLASAQVAKGHLAAQLSNATSPEITTTPAQDQEAEEAPAIQPYRTLIEGPLSNFIRLANEIGGAVAEQANATRALFEAQLTFLQGAARCRKPAQSDAAYQALIADTQTTLMAVINVQESGRERKYTNHLKTVSEGIPAVGWVTVEPKPGPYVKEMKEAAEFYSNRVIKEYKDTDTKHVDYARSFILLLEELRKYIMQFHTTGVAWNAVGEDPSTYIASRKPSIASVSSTNAGISTPPPPPVVPPKPPSLSPKSSPQVASPSQPRTGGMDSVFAQLNKGESVTTGLKKVDDSQKTHKNPELRGVGGPPVVASPQTSVTKAAQPGAPAKQKTAKTELDRNKWIIENHENNPSIIIKETAINHVVDVFNCKSSTIQIQGKVNAIQIVNCSKVSLLLDSLVSALSITNSPGFTVQVTGKVPTISVDATDSGQIYLGKESLDTEIISAKTSALNISLPVKGEEEGIYKEFNVPEQLKTVIQNGKLITTVVEHAG